MCIYICISLPVNIKVPGPPKPRKRILCMIILRSELGVDPAAVRCYVSFHLYIQCLLLSIITTVENEVLCPLLLNLKCFRQDRLRIYFRLRCMYEIICRTSPLSGVDVVSPHRRDRRRPARGR